MLSGKARGLLLLLLLLPLLLSTDPSFVAVLLFLLLIPPFAAAAARSAGPRRGGGRGRAKGKHIQTAERHEEQQVERRQTVLLHCPGPKPLEDLAEALWVPLHVRPAQPQP